MRLEFDLDVGALYIALADAPVARTSEAGENAAVDLDAGGRVIGIEVISAAHPWPLREILRDYPISDTDAAQLRAYFMSASAATLPAPQDTLPVMEAAPTAPSSVLVPA